MKAFLFSLFALGVLIAVIFCNAFYVRGVTKQAQDLLTAMPACADAGEEAQELLSHWQAEKRLLELSVCATDMSEIENRLTELCVATRTKDEKAFEQARALCLLGLARIQELERFRFLHIL